jgi:hypothetical protein
LTSKLLSVIVLKTSKIILKLHQKIVQIPSIKAPPGFAPSAVVRIAPFSSASSGGTGCILSGMVMAT